MIATECPSCQQPIPNDAPEGLCPRCLVRSALGNDLGHSVLAETSGIFPLSADVPTAAEVDRLIPSLEVLELIGHGGMGVVYLARQPSLDRKVALKLLSPRFTADPSFAERFEREARSLARLNHPNVLGIHDSGRAGDHYYLVLEYVEGTSLRDLVAGEPLGREQALSVARQVCEALQFAHDAGVLHRDVKPENVLLGEDGRVKLADFGLAKLVDASPFEASLTLTRQVMGTPHYMAPEAVRLGSNQSDPRGDVYAVGVMLYEALTGRLPLGRFQAPSELGHGDPELDAVVLRALESDPEARFASAGDMARALAAAERGGVAPALPREAEATPHLAQDDSPYVRPLAEHLALWSCAAAVIAVVLTPLAVLVWSEGGPSPLQQSVESLLLSRADTGARIHFGAKVLGIGASLALLLSAVLGRLALWEARRGWPLVGLRRFQALLGPTLLSALLLGALLFAGPALAAASAPTEEYWNGAWRKAPELWKFQLRRFLGTLIFSTMLIASWVSACPGLMRRAFHPLLPSGDATPLWMLCATSVVLFFAAVLVLQ